MNSVGIVTIVDYLNYGNRLQNYALQRFLKELGYESSTIVNRPRCGRWHNRLREKLADKSAADVLRAVAGKLSRKTRGGTADQALVQEKYRSCKQFSERFIRETDYTVYRDTESAFLNDEFSCFVVGSDQVWNPHYRRGFFLDMLDFAPHDRRIAFSASFGVAQLPQEYEGIYRKHLDGFKAISVRELKAAQLVQDLTGRDVPVTVDPTLNLSAQDWRELGSQHRQKPDGDYVLTYFLGDHPKICRELTAIYGERYGMSVVHLNDYRQQAYYAASPDEFVDFIDGARLVLTDSFHGAVFSILFETPFACFYRQGKEPAMGSRIDRLAELFSMQSRVMDAAAPALSADDLLHCDFSHVASVLDASRKHSRDFLHQALPRRAGQGVDNG